MNRNLHRRLSPQTDSLPRWDWTTRWEWTLSALRQSSKIFKLNSTFHIFRQLAHFGPWRVIPKFAIQKLRPPTRSQQTDNTSLLGSIDPNAIAAEIRQNSVAIVGALPTEFVNRLRQITDVLPANEYQLVHQVDNSIRQLAEDPGIKNVLRAYLKCEPALLEASLFVSNPEEGRPLQDQNSFHFDYAGWESLNAFVYLTDVQERSSCHIVAKGSHRNIAFLDVLRGSLSAEEGNRRFGATVQKITGPAGTLFFENTEAFHRRHQGNERRVMLNLLYASHQSLLSHGRASRKDLELRDNAFEKLNCPGAA